MNFAFGTYVVNAPFPLPSLPNIGEVRDNACLISVEWADTGITQDLEWQHHWIDRSQTQLSLARQETGYVLRVPGCADFLLNVATRTVRVPSISDSLDASTLEHLLVDQVFPRLLSQLGDTVIHAATVRIGQQHAVFLGDSGWGKSTLSGLLHRAGYPILSDDCLQLFPEPAGRVRVIPTYPSLRLKPDSLNALFPDSAGTMPFAGNSGKRRVPLAGSSGSQQAATADALYLLGDPSLADGNIRIVPISQAKACLALIRHSFRLDLADREASQLQLQRCASIASAIPGFELHYPHEHDRNAALLQTLLEHVGTLSGRSEESKRRQREPTPR